MSTVSGRSEASGRPELARGDDGVEVERLRRQVEELHSTLAAIRAGNVDAVIMGGPQGEQLYTLVSADWPYRVIVEQMADGAITVSQRGIVLYANRRVADLLGRSRADLLGSDVDAVVAPSSRRTLGELLEAATGVTVNAELELQRADGSGVHVLASVTALEFEGVLVRCLVLTDLTARRRDEKALADAYAELTVSARELEEAQRIGRIGSWRWDAATDRVTWSPQMYRIFGMEQTPDLTFSAVLAAASHPDDARLATAARERALVDHQPFTVRQRVIHAGGEIRHIVTRGEVLVDDNGVVTGLRGTTQDVTDAERATAEVLAAREQLLQQALQLAAEHRVKESLQQAVLPARLPAVTGAVLAARYLPADELAQVGGDWYDAFCLPDDTLVVAVGDVIGHDSDSAATMGQIRNALRAYAYAGSEPPSATLWRLNHLVSGLGDVGLATVVLARVAPGRRSVEWACAGHLPPLLISRDGARLLHSPRAAMLGTIRGESYTDTSVPLRPGDLLVLFTDGLVERRDRDLDAGLAELLVAAGHLRGATPEAACDGLVERLLARGHEDDVCLLAIQRS